MNENLTEEIIVTARSVEEAVQQGKEQLGEDADFEILQMPTRKFFGLKTIPAKVKIYIKKSQPVQKSTSKPEKGRNSEKRYPTKPDKFAEVKAPIKPLPKHKNDVKPVGLTKTSKPQEKQQKYFKESPQTSSVALETLAHEEKQIKITPESDYNEYVKKSLGIIKKIITQMGMENVSYRVVQEKTEAMILVEGEDASHLIGRHGETMNALQYLLSLSVNRKKDDYYRIILNIENYREKREKTLETFAIKAAKTVARTGRSQMLEPMNPYERRIIHSGVQKVAGAISTSVGEEPNRKVVIKSKNSANRKNANSSKKPYNKSTAKLNNPPIEGKNESNLGKRITTFKPNTNTKPGIEKPVETIYENAVKPAISPSVVLKNAQKDANTPASNIATKTDDSFVKKAANSNKFEINNATEQLIADINKSVSKNKPMAQKSVPKKDKKSDIEGGSLYGKIDLD